MRSSTMRRGVTLLEIMIASAMLTILVLVIASATIPLQRQASDSYRNNDQEAAARRILDMIRRDLRQTGWNSNLASDPMFTAGGAAPSDLADGTSHTLFTCRLRTGLGEADWSATEVSWLAVRDGSFSGVPTATPRYRLVRQADYDHDGTVEATEALELARGLSAVSILESAGTQSVVVSITLTEPDPRRDGPGIPPPLSRVFRDVVELRNGVRN